ncbi:flippase [Paraglaciecola sp.]|uniref:flippase n=1 Tax=Paraglaciecola sp. TaxID=1920173 RepID=UPI00273F6990|nr:flippase [Paraglaciecola sp.]MDP5033262.1 flippase [Paraglaciecola sp.]
MAIINNAIYLIVDRLIRVGLGFITGIILARYLGVTTFGELSSALSLRAIIIIFCALGLETFAIKELSRRQRQTTSIVSSLIVIRIITIVISALVIFIFYYYQYVGLVSLIISMSVIFQFFEPLEYHFKSVYRTSVIAKSSMLASILSFLIKITMVHFDFSIIYIALSYVFDIFFYHLLLFRFYFGAFGNLKLGRNFKVNLKFFTQEGIFLVFSSLSVIIYTKIDVIMLSQIKGDIYAGYYAAATRLSEIWFIFPPILTQAIVPYVARNFKKESSFGDLGKGMMQLIVVLSLSFIALIYIISDKLIYNLYGAEYVMSSDILRLHCVAGLFSAVGTIQASWMYSWGMAKFSAVKNIIACVIGVCLNYLLIPDFGVYGAASATIISLFLSSVVLNIFARQGRQVVISFFRSIILLDLNLMILIIKSLFGKIKYDKV